jgi:4'-phosphopantetheinyl transferase
MLDQAPDELARLSESLTADERARAKQFRTAVLRNRFVASRGMLRRLLGCYTGLVPQAIQFAHNPYGKPMLDMCDATGRPVTIQFNVSHSNDILLVAVACAHAVGVDVERVRQAHELDVLDLSKRFFSGGEYDMIRQVSDADQQLAFAKLWTCKEAYIKACGAGLSIPLDTFSIIYPPDGDSRPVVVNHQSIRSKESTDTGPWRLWSFTPTAGYAAALATWAGVDRIHHYTFNGRIASSLSLQRSLKTDYDQKN